MSVGGVGSESGLWGWDPNIGADEASAQSGFNLGALQIEIDRYQASVKKDPNNPDQAALAEITRLVEIINTYQNTGKLGPLINKAGVDVSKLLYGPPPLIGADGKADPHAFETFTNAYRDGGIASKILAWAFPSDGSGYQISGSTDPDTKFALIRFMMSFYGPDSPDLDSNMEGFFSQNGIFGSFALEAGAFIQLYLKVNEDKGNLPDGFKDELLQSFADKDPKTQLQNFDSFMKYIYEDLGDLGGMTPEEALKHIANHLSVGMNGTESDEVGTDQATPPSGGYGAGANPNTPIIPQPPLPPSGGPDGTLPEDKGFEWGAGADPYYDKLMLFMEYFHNKQIDPQAMMNFANYISALAANGKLTGPGSDKILQMLDKMGAGDILKSALEQAAQYAFFTSGSLTPPGDPTKTMTDYLTGVRDALQGLQDAHPNPLIAGMLESVKTQLILAPIWAKEHICQKDGEPPGAKVGDLFLKDKDSGNVYNWTHPADASDYGDRFHISLEVGAQGVPHLQKLLGSLHDLLSEYQVNTLGALLKEFSHDPMLAIMLWIMKYQDQNAQSEQSGANNQSQVVSKILTDKYANGLQTLAGTAGNWSGNDVDELKRLLGGGDDFMKLSPEMKGLADNWKRSVSGPIENITVTVGGKSVSLQAYLNDTTISSSTKASTLNDLFKPGVTGGSPTNANYQLLTQSTTAGTQLANGQSKNITTQLSTIVATEAAILKTLDAITNPSTGLMSMFKYFVNQQKS